MIDAIHAPTDPAALPAVRFQPMTPAQLSTVSFIEQLSHDHPWTYGNFLDSLRTGWHAQCLMAGHELAGYFIAMPGVNEVHLLNITVAPAYRGQGWARVMLDALALWARSLGMGQLWLEVRLGNVRALRIYERYGFVRTGLRRDYYLTKHGVREDAILMSFLL